MGEMVKCPIKLAVRDRGEWIEAILCPNEPDGDKAEDAVVLGRLLASAAQMDRQLFEEWWKPFGGHLQRQMNHLLAGTPLEVTRMDVIRKKFGIDN